MEKLFMQSTSKTENDGKIKDISLKTVPELLELRDRQQKLLSNKTFVNRLADKGARIRAFHNKILKELEAKQDEEQTCRLFNELNLNKQSVQQVEWGGKLENKKDDYLDSDDDSDLENLLPIILSKGTAQDKQVKVLQPEKLLVTPEDLVAIGELSHIKYIVNKTETNAKPKTSEFKPYRTTISDSQNPEKEKHTKKNKHWEVTAATPPPSVHGPAKVLSLEESLKLQKEYNSHIKEIEAKHAAEKLLERTGVKMGELPQDVRQLGRYRDVVSEESDDSDPEGSDKEVHDEEPEKGGVTFPIME